MNQYVRAAVMKILEFGPSRCMIDEYEAKPSAIAREMYGCQPIIIFIRDDGWSLGAPKGLVMAAERIWRDKWAAVMLKGQKEAIPYMEYCERKTELLKEAGA